MVNFINHCLGSSAWLIIKRLQKLRELNKKKGEEIEEEVAALKENSRPKYLKLNWL